ncbi:MAG: SRPBCC family protein [Tetrasphaera sp.]
MSVAARPLAATIEIAAPAEAVWAVVSDVRRTGEWSPECRKVLARGPVSEGSRIVGLNRRGLIVWPTTAKVVRCEPGKAIAWRVTENGTTWSYELEPSATGTRLTERREASAGVTRLSATFTAALLGGNDEHSDELEQGMRAGLATIKQIVEARQPGHAGTW